MYNIIVYKLNIIKINQGARIIKKRYFQLVNKVDNVPKSELSKKYLELKAIYKDFNYIIDLQRVEGEKIDIIKNYNEKSKSYINLS